MFEARIISSSGSLYFAGEPTPYDLQNLRSHIQEFSLAARDVRLEVSIDDADWKDLERSGWLQTLSRAGARVSRAPGH